MRITEHFFVRILSELQLSSAPRVQGIIQPARYWTAHCTVQSGRRSARVDR